MSDVNGQYEMLGVELKDRLGHQQASLGLREKAKQSTEELKNWLTERELSLKQAQTASPSKPEVLRAQAQDNKVCQAFPEIIVSLFKSYSTGMFCNCGIKKCFSLNRLSPGP